MSMDYNIRLIQKNEMRQLLELYQHFNNGDKLLSDSKELDKLWNEIYDNPNHHYIVAETDGKLVASCVMILIKNLTRDMRPYSLIENVVTHKDYRNIGLGKKVLAKAVEISKDHNCYKVMLMTGSKEESTINFYRSAGFKDGIKKGFLIDLK